MIRAEAQHQVKEIPIGVATDTITLQRWLDEYGDNGYALVQIIAPFFAGQPWRAIFVTRDVREGS